MCEKNGGCGGCGGSRDVGLLAEAVRQMLIPSEVLAVISGVIPAGGVITFDHFHAPFAAVAVNVVSTGATGITIVAGTVAGPGAPGPGPGVAFLPANKGGVWNLRGNALTIWGTAGDTVTVQAFTRPQPATWG